MNLKGDHIRGPALFGMVFVTGVIWIVASKIYLQSSQLSILITVMFMVGYALIVAIPMFRLRDDQTGDNLYYLGFLYTLTSLAVALYQFSIDTNIDQIIRSFGVAISSTIVGIALRVVFVQMRRDPIDVEREARLELSQAARRVRRELDATVFAMSNFQRTMTQVISEGFKSVETRVDEISNKLTTSIEHSVKTSNESLAGASTASASLIGSIGETSASQLKEAGAVVSGTLQESAKSISTENDRITKGFAQFGKSIDDIAAKMAAMQTPDKIIEVKLEPLIGSLTLAIEAMTKQAQAISASNSSQHAKMDTISKDLITFTATLDGIGKVLSQQSSKQEAMTNAVTQFSAAAVQIIRENKEATNRTADQVAKMAEVFQSAYGPVR